MFRCYNVDCKYETKLFWFSFSLDIIFEKFEYNYTRFLLSQLSICSCYFILKLIPAIVLNIWRVSYNVVDTVLKLSEF